MPLAALSALCLVAAVPAAHAQRGLDATFVSSTPVTGGTQFNYNLVFTSNNYGAGAPPNIIDSLQTGDFFTLYDVPGLTGTPVAGTGFTETTELLSPEPNNVPAGIIPDSPTISNVVFTYNGSTVTSGTFTGFSLVSTATGTGSLTYADQYHAYSTNGVGGSGSVFGPAALPTAVAPEPSSVAAFAFTSLSAAGLILRARKRKMSL